MNILSTIFIFCFFIYSTAYANQITPSREDNSLTRKDFDSTTINTNSIKTFDLCRNNLLNFLGIQSVKELDSRSIKNIEIFDYRLNISDFQCYIYNKNKHVIIKKIIIEVSISDIPGKLLMQMCLEDPDLLNYVPFAFQKYTIEEIKKILKDPEEYNKHITTNSYKVNVNINELETSKINIHIKNDIKGKIDSIKVLRAYGYYL